MFVYEYLVCIEYYLLIKAVFSGLVMKQTVISY